VAGSTATYNGSLSNAVVLSSWTYKNLQINGSGTFLPLGEPLTIQENLTLTQGTLDKYRQ